MASEKRTEDRAAFQGSSGLAGTDTPGRRLERWAPVVLLGLLAFALFSLLQGGGALYFGHPGSDLVTYFYPRTAFVSRWLKQGVYPFWDPHAFGGYPVIETQQLAMFYLPTLVSTVLFEAGSALLAAMSLHLITAGVCTYLGMRKGLRLSPCGAAVGTLVYVFGQGFASRVGGGHLTVVAASAWMPLGVVALARAVRFQPRARLTVSALRLFLRCRPFVIWWLVAASANAMTMLAGAPQYVVFLFWAELVAALAAISPRRWPATAGIVAAAWCLAAVVSAPQWLPALSYLPYSSRGAMTFPSSASVREAELFGLELLLPSPLGGGAGLIHLHKKAIWETATYPGTAAVILTLAAAGSLLITRRRRRWRWRVGVGILAVGLYLTFGYGLPGLRGFREPLKARILVAMAIGFCAALEFDALRGRVARGGVRRRSAGVKEEGTRSGRVLGAGPAVLSAAVVILLLAVFGLSLNPSSRLVTYLLSPGNAPFERDSFAIWHKATENPMILLDWIREAVVQALIVGVLVLGLLVVFVRRPQAALAGLFLAACLEPFFLHRSYFESKHPFEGMNLPRDLRQFFSVRIEDTLEHRQPLWRVVFPNSLMNQGHFLDGLWETGGYDPLAPASAAARNLLAGNPWASDEESLQQRVAAATGARYRFFHWDEYPEPKPPLETLVANPEASIASIERTVVAGALTEDLSMGPSVTGIHYLLPVPPPAKEESAALDGEFVHRVERICREGGPTTETLPGVTVLHPGESLTMEPEIDSPNRHVFSATLRRPGVLVVRVTWLPGWTAWVDGERFGRPWSANRWMLAVPLEAGTHVVEFRYRPVRLGIAIGLSMAGALAVFGMLVASRRPRPTRK